MAISFMYSSTMFTGHESTDFESRHLIKNNVLYIRPSVYTINVCKSGHIIYAGTARRRTIPEPTGTVASVGFGTKSRPTM
jgi:hypothetical protein